MDRIQLSLIGNTAYCFNADGNVFPFSTTLISLKMSHFPIEDYMKIRTQCRIIGKLIGPVVKWPRNVNING